MQTNFHLHIKKEYAAALIEDLIKVEAVEVVEEKNIELTTAQQQALDKELLAIKSDPDYLLDWEVVKRKYIKA